MKILYITPFLRVPADFGLGIRNYQFLQHLSQNHQVFVITYGADTSGETDQWLKSQGIGYERLPFIHPRSKPNSIRSSILQRFKYPPNSFKAYRDVALKEHIRHLKQS